MRWVATYGIWDSGDDMSKNRIALTITSVLIILYAIFNEILALQVNGGTDIKAILSLFSAIYLVCGVMSLQSIRSRAWASPAYGLSLVLAVVTGLNFVNALSGGSFYATQLLLFVLFAANFWFCIRHNKER